ncbi:NlpC/P60 family protein [Planctomicrobium piriforme]|uniref:Cell wall-associated hydrolase, NlpC family n=1 Tax=Planctomicrobium piriforme TaxID=1576369 RepID=A0A1I3KPM7_9PLAN|nr:NlpC/P60 family protein [Planctomicrobium piriforme]SFI74324.1 Cell wall-associated hydrolase, NlpC family [Planctomicrobium piriforme]
MAFGHPKHLIAFRPLALMAGLAILGADVCLSAQDIIPEERERSAYRTPYRIEFATPRAELVSDLEGTERGDPRFEAEIPHDEWYSRRVLEHRGAWGPVARAYPGVPGIESWPVQARRERVVAIAMRFLGYGYQHHHLPDWSPPREWPWKETCVGHNGRGVDCSNFTGFVYNQGFGLRFNTEVERQAEEREVRGPGESRMTPVQHVPLPESYQDRIAALRTGDLLFIRSDSGNISHVVIWVGGIGQSPDGAPLIIDSHGGEVEDSNGARIPCGIHIRPYREKSWYNHSASHAIRVFVE